MNKLIFLTVILAAAAAPACSEIFDTAHQVVYNKMLKDIPTMTPDQTLAFLMDLRASLKKYPDPRRRTINLNLLRVADVNEDHCKDFRYMMLMVRTYRLNLSTSNPKNVIPYIRHFMPQQFQVCSRFIREQFDKFKTKAVEEDLKKMDDMLSMMEVPREGAADMSPIQIGRGVALYAEKRRHADNKLWFLRLKSQAIDAKRNFYNYVRDFCHALDKVFWPIMYVPMVEQELASGVDPEIYQYMRKVLIVHNIAVEETTILYHMLKASEMEDSRPNLAGTEPLNKYQSFFLPKWDNYMGAR